MAYTSRTKVIKNKGMWVVKSPPSPPATPTKEDYRNLINSINEFLTGDLWILANRQIYTHILLCFEKRNMIRNGHVSFKYEWLRNATRKKYEMSSKFATLGFFFRNILVSSHYSFSSK